MPHRDDTKKGNESEVVESGPKDAKRGDVPDLEATIDAGTGSPIWARSSPVESSPAHDSGQWQRTVFRDQGDLLRKNEVLASTYHVRQLIGQGGMAQVYEAYDPLLKRSVAIKASRPHVARGWLHSEAQTLASLRHPALMTIHGMGTHRDIDYIVLERLYGLTLRTHLKQRQASRPFAIDEALEILVSLADVLAYVHKNNIVHRDLKPENVMLEGNRRVVLLDFGIVAAAHTQEHTTLSGSPHYMAPEIVTTDGAASHSAAVDIYALGVVAYELLSGKRPFRGTSATEILDKHINEEVPDLRAIRPDVPEQLSRLVAEMLAKRPDDRPASADVVTLWLRALQRGRAPERVASDLDVIIVDDDPDMMNLVAGCVEHAAPTAHIRTAVNGLEAVQLFHDKPPDLLLFDIHMPKMTGVELCMYLVGTHLADKTELVGVSAHATDDDRYLLKRLGVASVLNKRVPATQLLTKLIRVIHRVRNTRSAILRQPSDIED